MLGPGRWSLIASADVALLSGSDPTGLRSSLGSNSSGLSPPLPLLFGAPLELVPPGTPPAAGAPAGEFDRITARAAVNDSEADEGRERCSTPRTSVE